MRKKLLIIGAGGHAESSIDVIESNETFEIIGLIGHPQELGRKISGYEVIGNDSDLWKFRQEVENVFIAVGQIKSTIKRRELFNKAEIHQFKFPTIISSRATVSKNSNIGQGSIIHHNVLINAGANIGQECIINSGSIIEHGCNVGNFVHISTGVILNGNSQIGNDTFIGSGTIIKQNVKIGENCLIDMSSVVYQDLATNKKRK